MVCFQHVYRVSILSEKMVYDLVRTLKIEHVELEKNAASAIFQVKASVLRDCLQPSSFFDLVAIDGLFAMHLLLAVQPRRPGKVSSHMIS